VTSRNLILVTDLSLDEHTVAAGCKCNIATADATLVVEQAAETSQLSSCVDRIVEMLVSRSCKKLNWTTSSQQVLNKSTTNRRSGD